MCDRKPQESWYERQLTYSKRNTRYNQLLRVGTSTPEGSFRGGKSKFLTNQFFYFLAEIDGGKSAETRRTLFMVTQCLINQLLYQFSRRFLWECEMEEVVKNCCKQ